MKKLQLLSGIEPHPQPQPQPLHQSHSLKGDLPYLYAVSLFQEQPSKIVKFSVFLSFILAAFYDKMHSQLVPAVSADFESTTSV